MPKNLIAALPAALTSAGLFLLAAYLGLGFLFLFLPTLPLFLAGLSGNTQKTLAAGLMAGLLVAAAADTAAGVFFLLLFALPAWHICRLAVLWRQSGDSREWFPLGTIFLRLTLYAAALIALMTWFYAADGENLQEMTENYLSQALESLGGDYAAAVEPAMQQWAFLVFPASAWAWALVLFGCGWLAQSWLLRKQQNIRPDFAVGVFAMPSWMPALLAAGAAVSLIGGENAAFLAKSSLITLLFPYFLLGAAVMHAASRSWSNRRFFLFFIYFLIVTQAWPALILSGIGLWHHIKRLSGAADSTRN